MSEKKMTYAGSGVDYDAMDPFKRAATKAAAATAKNLRHHGFTEVPWSRGESAYLIDIGDRYMALVEEGLGTKNLVADHMWGTYGGAWHAAVAQDTVAMIVNDMITLGALPVAVAMHLAVGRSDWLKAEERAKALIDGWKKACDLAECSWGGGETPTLKDIVEPGTAVLSGSAAGFTRDKARVFGPHRVQDGDTIIFLGSNGIHANGLTLARELAGMTSYQALIPGDRMFGDALLDPTPIYVPFIRACLDWGVDVHYAVNVTGHGWRKLMRAPQPFTYEIDKVPEPQPIFRFIQEKGRIDEREMYGNYNMGAGFALYVPESDVRKVVDLFHHHAPWTFDLHYNYGRVRASDEKKVVIKPKGITFTAEDLKVR